MFKYIFYMRDNTVSSYHFRGSNFEPLKELGEETIELIENKFWEWWKEKSNHTNEKVDFCFIGMIENNNFLESFTPVLKSDWSEKEIKMFLKEKIKDRIIDISKLKIETFPKKEFKNLIIKKGESKEKERIEDKKKESDLAFYFRKKTAEIKLN